MASINRFTQYQPAQYEPRTLQEMLVAPQYMREKHDEQSQYQAAASEILGNIDTLEAHDGFLDDDIAQYRASLNEHVDNLAESGFTPNSKADFVKYVEKLQNYMGPKGRGGRVLAAKEAMATQTEQVMEQAKEEGHDMAATKANIQEYIQNYNADAQSTGEIKNIDMQPPPKYKDFMESMKDFKSLAGSVSTTLGHYFLAESNEPGSALSINYNSGLNKFEVTTADGKQVNDSNINNLLNLLSAAYNDWILPGGEGFESDKWNKVDHEKRANEILSIFRGMIDSSFIDDRSFNHAFVARDSSSIEEEPEEPTDAYAKASMTVPFDFAAGGAQEASDKSKEAIEQGNETGDINRVKAGRETQIALEDARYSLDTDEEFNSEYGEGTKNAEIIDALDEILDPKVSNIRSSTIKSDLLDALDYFESDLSLEAISEDSLDKFSLKNRISGTDYGFIKLENGNIQAISKASSKIFTPQVLPFSLDIPYWTKLNGVEFTPEEFEELQENKGVYKAKAKAEKEYLDNYLVTHGKEGINVYTDGQTSQEITMGLYTFINAVGPEMAATNIYHMAKDGKFKSIDMENANYALEFTERLSAMDYKGGEHLKITPQIIGGVSGFEIDMDVSRKTLGYAKDDFLGVKLDRAGDTKFKAFIPFTKLFEDTSNLPHVMTLINKHLPADFRRELEDMAATYNMSATPHVNDLGTSVSTDYFVNHIPSLRNMDGSRLNGETQIDFLSDYIVNSDNFKSNYVVPYTIDGSNKVPIKMDQIFDYDALQPYLDYLNGDMEEADLRQSESWNYIAYILSNKDNISLIKSMLRYYKNVGDEALFNSNADYNGEEFENKTLFELNDLSDFEHEESLDVVQLLKAMQGQDVRLTQLYEIRKLQKLIRLRNER